jgi:Na+/H+-dicarboxylate symporter/ABC-type amino acid transport substrate-binding protein
MPESLMHEPSTVPRRKLAITLPQQVVLGATLGIAAGIIFGERTAVLQPIGNAYGAMLQIAVFPYILCSLMHGLGSLSPAVARRMLRAGWLPFLFLWVLTFASIWLLAHAIPPARSPAFLSTATESQTIPLTQLLIPSNPFSALRDNYVPAVVVFAIIYGIALQKIAQKNTLLEILSAVKVASVTIWRWVIILAPLGVFALLATTAGTVRPDRLTGLLVYVGLYLAGAAILGLIVIPMLLSAIVPLGYGEILRGLRPAMVIAIGTTLSVAALPLVQHEAESILDRVGAPKSEERDSLVQTALSLSYVFAQLGNYFVYLLIFYSSYVADLSFTLAEKITLPLMTLLSCLGSPSATYDSVDFLSNWLHLPPSVFTLYVETSAITRFGQVLVSVAGFAFITLVIPLVYLKRARFQAMPFVAAIATCIVLCAGVALGAISSRSLLFPPREHQYASLKLDPQLTNGVSWKIAPIQTSSGGRPAESGDLSIASIRKRGVLRVGFNPEIIPFSYKNANDDLVGFDIAFSYRLARDLGVSLEFIPFTWPDLTEDLRNHRFDIAMSGLYETDERLQSLTISSPYYQSRVALLVPSRRAWKFADESRKEMSAGLKLAVFNDPVLLKLSRTAFPDAQFVTIESYSQLPAMMTRVDAAVWTLEQATAWSAEHPGFTAVVPKGTSTLVPIAYALPPDSGDLGAYVRQWLQLRIDDGFRDQQIEYWIRLRRVDQGLPRWNLLDYLERRYRQRAHPPPELDSGAIRR